MSSTHPTAAATARRARWGRFRVRPQGGGVFAVENRDNGHEYTVVLRDGRFECSCPSYNYHVIHGPLEECKHSGHVARVIDGVLCAHCGYPRCRPSCPNRSDTE